MHGIDYGSMEKQVNNTVKKPVKKPFSLAKNASVASVTFVAS